MNQEQLIKAKLEIIKNEFKEFVQEIIGLKNAPFQNEFDDIISDSRYKNICITIARGHGKSTHLSVAYPLWEMARNHNVRILLVSSTADIARGFVNEIHNILERNEKYNEFARAIDSEDIGVTPKMRSFRKKEEKWSSSALTIERSEINMKDPTINALGLFGSILSKRADIIIVDDLVNQQNSVTEEQRQKIKDWVDTSLRPILVPGGRFIYLGNTWHANDLVQSLLSDPMTDYKRRIPAVLQDATNQDLWAEWYSILSDETFDSIERKTRAEEFYLRNKEKMDEGVKVLWPERFTYQHLYSLRMHNSYSFSRMYQCDPSNRPDQRFKEEWLTAARIKGSNLRLQDDERKEFVVDRTASGLDLAISMDESSDDTVLFTLDKVRNSLVPEIKAGDYVVRNIRRGKMTPNTVREMVRTCWQKINQVGIRVETVGYQKSMAIDLEESGIPVTSYHTGGEKHDPAIGVNSLAIIAENNKLVIPYDLSDANTVRLCSQLMDEMRSFPEGHTGDSLMAMWFAFSELRDNASGRYTRPTTVGSSVATQPTVDLQDKAARLKAEQEADKNIVEAQLARQLSASMKGFIRRNR